MFTQSRGIMIDPGEGTIAEQIRTWLEDLRIMRSSPYGYPKVLCYCYNWATNPARLETDREARATGRLAAYCRRRLAGLPGWHESDSGRLWC